MAPTMAPLVLWLIVPAASDFDSAYYKAFRDNFRASSIQACMAAVTHPVPAGFDLRAVCACAADRVMRSKSPAEMAAASEAEVDAATAACFDAEIGKARRR